MSFTTATTSTHNRGMASVYRAGLQNSVPINVGLAVLALFLACVAFLPEYDNGGVPEHGIYQKAFGPFRPVDLLLPAVAVICLFRAGLRIPIHIPPRFFLASALLLAGGLVAVVYGYETGGEQLFYDWKNIVHAILITLVVITQCRTSSRALALFTYSYILSGLYAIYLLVAFFSGGGTVRLDTGGRIPVDDGPTLSLFVFATLYASLKPTMSITRRERIIALFGLPCCLVVLMSARRTYWAELGMSFLILFVLKRNSVLRVRTLMLFGIAGMVATLALGPERLTSRLESMNPFQRGTVASSTNADHVNDVLDAWDRIQESPILGIGLGKPYVTYRISGWKKQSWGVHNALLHVWLLYGIVTLIGFLLWHFFLMQYLLTLLRQQERWLQAGASLRLEYTTSFVWMCSAFIVGCFFSPWQYGSLQLMTQVGMVWGITFGALTAQRAERFAPHGQVWI